jgi:hypothetical protein
MCACTVEYSEIKRRLINCIPHVTGYITCSYVIPVKFLCLVFFWIRNFCQFRCRHVQLSGQGKRIWYKDLLRVGRFGDRILMGVSFPAPVQTGCGANPGFCWTGIGTFPGVHRSGNDLDYSSSFSAEVKGRVELYTCSPAGPSWPVQ